MSDDALERRDKRALRAVEAAKRSQPRPKPRPKREPNGRMRVVVAGRTAALLSGELDVADLDEEELARGYCKDKNGRFSGRPPMVVPRELHDRMRRELLKRGDDLFAESFVEAVRTMANIALDTRAEDKDRIKAAQYVIERVAGKVPEKVELSAADPWQSIIDKIVVDDTPQTVVVEGEVVK